MFFLLIMPASVHIPCTMAQAGAVRKRKARRPQKASQMVSSALSVELRTNQKQGRRWEDFGMNQEAAGLQGMGWFLGNMACHLPQKRGRSQW